jgi:hypothetical protein
MCTFVFSDLEGHANGPKSKRHRFKPLTLRFMRSVAARTPSAHAHDWTVAWNLAGSLHTSADAVRETLFHEIFHLNDDEPSHRPPDNEAWSLSALGYAAELALRYDREQRAIFRELPKVRAFKCEPPENARAWALMRDEFFDAVDQEPACH